MHKFYEFKPVDTLYFRGAEPMNMGQDHTSSSIFPPPAHTISGAIRTAYLKQHDIDFKDYAHGSDVVRYVEDKQPNGKDGVARNAATNGNQSRNDIVEDSDDLRKIIEDIGEAGKPAPFSVIGPLLKKGYEIYIPAPYSWYREKSRNGVARYVEDANGDTGKDGVARNAATTIIKSTRISSPLIQSRQSLQWAKGSGELESIGGKWIKLENLFSGDREMDLYPLTHKDPDKGFVEFEIRTGIALEHEKRTVREGHLYSFSHARLKEDVSLVFGIDREIALDDSGVLRLGAEQRFGHYGKIPNPMTGGDGDQFLALSAVKGTEEANRAVIATGKIQYVGGWDMKKKFHKPMRGFYPAGTVFNKNINDNCIAIPGGK